MCFGRNKCQNNPEHCKYRNPNNCCGGFALNAVLVELKKPDDPMEVYEEIQKYQKTEVLPNKESVGAIFLNESLKTGNGTYMSLPSGICAAFKTYVPDKTVQVLYNSRFAKRDKFKALIPEESFRIKERLKMEVEQFEDLLPKTDRLYVLVLVKDCHWVAVKRKTEKEETSFICYDPAEGTAIVGETMEKSLENSKYKIENISGLFICI